MANHMKQRRLKSKISIVGLSVLVTSMALVMPMHVYAAELTLEADKSSVAVGKTLNVNVNLRGRESTIGTDLVMTYDPKMLQVLGVEGNTLYPVYNPAASSRVNASTGTIKLSGSASLGKPVNADGTFGIIRLKALVSGSSQLTISYQKGSTSLSGVLGKNGQELLNSAPKPLTITTSGDVPKQPKTLSLNPVVGFFQTVMTSMIGFFTSLFSWTK